MSFDRRAVRLRKGDSRSVCLRVGTARVRRSQLRWSRLRASTLTLVFHDRLAGSSFSAVGRSPLFRAQVSFALMWTSESAFVVSLAVVTFRAGGVAAVGIVTALRMATAALLTPFLATTADHVRREVVLVAIGIVRAIALARTAPGALPNGPPTAGYALSPPATVA